MNLYSTIFININLIEHFFLGGGREEVFLVLKWFYQFYTYFGSRVELVTKIPKSTPGLKNIHWNLTTKHENKLPSLHLVCIGRFSGVFWILGLFKYTNFEKIKIQPKTIDLGTRLWGIATKFVGFIPQSLVQRSIV